MLSYIVGNQILADLPSFLTRSSAGVINGLLIAFTMSIDDFVISYFTAGSTFSTLSMVIYSMAKKRVSPEINALSTLLFVVVVTLLVIVNVRQTRQDKRRMVHGN